MAPTFSELVAQLQIGSFNEHIQKAQQKSFIIFTYNHKFSPNNENFMPDSVIALIDMIAPSKISYRNKRIRLALEIFKQRNKILV